MKVFDSYPGQIVHIQVGGFVYHVEVAGDALSARCLETDHYVRGKNRAESLQAMARRLSEHVAEHANAEPRQCDRPAEEPALRRA